MKRPLVIAHRGNSASAPENTLAAIREAIEIGTDCVEVDIRCTRDGVPVLHHDPAVGRTAGGKGNVSDFTLEEIRTLDAGIWKGENYRGERIPTLEEALIEARGKTNVVAEVKVDCAEQIVEVVRRLRLDSGLYFASFRHDYIQKLYRMLPMFDIVWVLTAPEWLGYNAASAIETASESDIRVIAPPVPALTQPSVSCAHEMGLGVWTYACDSTEDFRKALDATADGIVTGNPADLLALMEAESSRVEGATASRKWEV